MANQVHIKWLLEGNEKWNARRDSHSFRPDFSFSDIYENFRKASKLDHNGRIPLNRFNLSDANFNGAILKNVNLIETNLTGARMGVKSLDGTSFSETDLTGAQFGTWFFEGMNFGYATLKDTNFTHAELTGADLTGSQLWEAKLFSERSTAVKSNPEIDAGRTIECVTDLIQKCFEIRSRSEGMALYFRGERDYRWTLHPSVMRPSHDGSFKLRNKEGDMLRDLISKRPEDFSDTTSALEQLVIAQHHGLKTRLLDVTRDPCVAMFSACDDRDPAGMSHRNDIDGELHVFAVPHTLVKSFDSDTISIISNFAKLERDYQGLLLGKTIEAIFGEGRDTGFKPLYTEGMRRLYHFIRQEKPQFEKIIDPKDFFRVFVVEPKQSFERIRSQEGAFLISAFHERFEREEVLKNTQSVPIYDHFRFIVPGDKKKAILDQLELLSVTRETLYPSLDETAIAITTRVDPPLESQITDKHLIDWIEIETIGAGAGPETECERCGNLGTPRQQFEHMGVPICFMCAGERVAELGTE